MAADVPGEHVAVIDADPHADLWPPLTDPALVQLRDRPLHGDRRAHRAVGIIGMRDRRAPEGHDRVADELVERAAVLEDHLHHLGEVLAQELGDGVRPHRFGHRGEATDVAEEHRGGPALAALADGAFLLRDIGRDVGREVALEVGADGDFAADLLRVAGVLDADGREPAERHEELQVLVGERVGSGEIVHVEQAEKRVGRRHERGAHGAPDALQENGLAAETRVGRRILGDHRHPLLDHLLGDRPRHLQRLGVALAAA